MAKVRCQAQKLADQQKYTIVAMQKGQASTETDGQFMSNTVVSVLQDKVMTWLSAHGSTEFWFQWSKDMSDAVNSGLNDAFLHFDEIGRHYDHGTMLIERFCKLGNNDDLWAEKTTANLNAMKASWQEVMALGMLVADGRRRLGFVYDKCSHLPDYNGFDPDEFEEDGPSA